jgi:4-hydroxybenzoate polyprenyltransferase
VTTRQDRTRPGRAAVALLRAAHPEPAIAVTAVAGLLALAVGHRPATAALMAAVVAASQLAVGWANDAIDAPRDAAVGRTGKPIVAGTVGRRTVAVGAGTAAAGTVLLALPLPPPATLAAVVALAGGLAYNWPLKLTPLSALPYAVSFAALPAFVVLALPATPPLWLLATGGLLGAGAHFANVLPDLADDASTGVRGLPHRLGGAGSALAAGGLLLAATLLLAAGPPGPPSWPGGLALLVAVAALATGWYADRRATAAGRRPVALFRAFQAVALVDVALLLLAGRAI